jgi:hypothetical protein
MTTTYVPANLATSNLYQVRFNLGDTDATSYELQDEEIDWAIQLRGNNWGATAMCALALASKYARLTSISADGVSQDLGQRVTSFRQIALEYQRKEVIYCATPTLFGVSILAQLQALGDSDRTPNIFRIGMSDDPPNTIRPVGDPPSGSVGMAGPA